MTGDTRHDTGNPFYTKVIVSLYASPYYNNRQLLWKNLMYLCDHYKGPWIIGGDFNEILHSIEKFGGRSINNSRSNQFTDCINYCNLVDLGFKDSKYTWTNKRRYAFHIL